MSECIAKCGREAYRWRLCLQDGVRLAGCCYGKRRWSRVNGARGAIRDHRVKTMHPYPCPVCSFWHTGHVTEQTQQYMREALEIVQAIRRAGNGFALGMLADQWARLDKHDRMAWKLGRLTTEESS